MTANPERPPGDPLEALDAHIARKSDEIRIVQQITARIGTTLDLDELLAISLEALNSSLGFEHAMILFADEAGETLTVAASHGYPDAGSGVTVPAGQGVLGVAARRRRITRIGNMGAQRAYIANVRRQMVEAGKGDALAAIPRLPGLVDAESEIAIPFVVKDRLIGVLAVESPKPGAFDELDEMVLSIVANELAHAIDNARLHASAVDRSRALDAANAALKSMNESLERTVAERTAELTEALATARRESALREELLRRMAPPAVVPLLLEDRLVARRLEVSVLFVDLMDFTAFSSGMEPNEVFALLNRFFSWAGEVIERYRGYVNKTSGDGIMALFGVPFETATHATDAALAGLALQDELSAQFPFAMRVGINSGAVTAGMLGPRNRSTYDVLGDAANVASRMEELCPPGWVAVSPETAGAIEPYFALSPLGEQAIKGKGMMECFAVAGLKPLLEDARRVDPTSRFATAHGGIAAEIETAKRARLSMIDFASLQARDAALGHNEAVAAFALALLRDLRAQGESVAGPVAAIDESDLVIAALLHDSGKHAVAAETLNRPSLAGAELAALRTELREATLAVLERIGFASLAPVIRELYRFEEVRGAEGEYGAAAEILAAADIYDALTAPKRYKGQPWRIAGALAEIRWMPYCARQQRPAFETFVELMRPKDTAIGGGARPRVVLR
jgi:adenylate cyclase